jgi:hypothetical protein
MSDQLVFVYNADIGIAAAIIDSIHKTLSPATYACSLCAITYGSFTMDRRWRAWLKALPLETVFYHRQDFHAAHPDATVALPAVLRVRGGAVETVMTAAELDAVHDVDGLIAVLEGRL